MDILQNPFFILGATTRDGRRRIMQLAEQKSFLSEGDVGEEASSTLSNPRKRLAAEVAWLPGIGPRRVAESIALLQSNPAAILDQTNLPPLARANLLAAGLIRAVESLSSDEVAEWIIELAAVYEDVPIESTVTLINEERAIAKFPEVTDVQALEAELEGRRQYLRRAIKDALNKLLTANLVEAITVAVESATEGGEVHAPILIDDLVESFEVEAQGFLARETQNITLLIDQIRKAVENEHGDAALNRLITKLEQVVKNWDFVVQPIQVSKRSRGLDHPLSHKVAGEIRGLAIELFNAHGYLEVSRRLITLQQEIFAEVDKIAEQAVEDSIALDEIAEQRTQSLREAQECAERWRQEITYEAEWGLIFKNKLKISPDGVEWKGQLWTLDRISRVRWGGTRHSVNGIPTGTTYSIFVGSDWDGASIQLNQEKVYSEFAERLWKAVGTRLLTEMLERLRDGVRYRFGTAVVDDYGVELERFHLFSANERVHCQWIDLVIGNVAGSFYIAKKDEKKVSVQLSYQNQDNVHILETAMRIFWKHTEPRMSSLLTREG